MSKSDSIELEGKVTELLPSARFRVELENGHEIIAYLSGKMRQNYVKVQKGDTVKVAVSIYDYNKGRITFRNK
ncbi:MAG TPA: translation initiation factor IF-1 [Candidatus Stercoripulliclostridium merdipullorum]|uniref:Translation initiation factor IF-1 n=1 Tax=Candidatus Stercoripulliclostridium merdipullorum TaxID=2840952 RepID=A0A9D1NBT5_9FIRM|nr:translation initiation factor IF-1 [Candidatus Stercoripulliclostridium merdipullorum]